MMKLFLVLFFIFFNSMYVNTYAQVFNKKLTSYSCKYPEDILSCDKNCVKDSSLTMDFLTNKEDKAVMVRGYDNGKIFHNATFKNCNIFDSKNWDCSETHGSAITEFKMANGIYYSSQRNIFLNPYRERYLFFSCAR